MKKLLLSSLIVTSALAFAYTQTDVDNATYLAGKGIITSQSTATGYRLDDTITRAEVAGIALKLRGTTLPEGYTCKRYFGDAIRNDWICRAVELAADAELVSRANIRFRPQDKITRAEVLAILMKAGGIKIKKFTPSQMQSTGGLEDSWQRDVLWTYFNTIQGVEFGYDTNYAPNNYILRAEVFSFAADILKYKATMSGEVTL